MHAARTIVLYGILGVVVLIAACYAIRTYRLVPVPMPAPDKVPQVIRDDYARNANDPLGRFHASYCSNGFSGIYRVQKAVGYGGQTTYYDSGGNILYGYTESDVPEENTHSSWRDVWYRTYDDCNSLNSLQH